MPRKSLEQKGAAARARAVSAKTVADRILDRMAEPNALANGELFAGLVQAPTGLSYGYNGRYWEPVTPATLARIAYLGDIAETGTAKKSRIGDIVTLLQAAVYKHDLEFMRCADHEIPVRNGVVDVLTNTLRPHRREDWLAGVLPVDFDRNARATELEKAMEDWFGEPGGQSVVLDDRADALIDFFGYIALPHAKFKRALVLFGESDTGKSQPLKIARRLVGEKFCCALGVDQMDDPQMCAMIKHKRLNVLTELTSDAMIKDGGFKTMVSTEEAIPINPKYEPPHDYTPIAKHIIATNVLPTINDRSAATFNRLLIIPFTRVFEESEQDKGFFDRATTPEQLSGLLNLAIQGAARLIRRGGVFKPPKAGTAINQQMRRDANPMFDFVAAEMVREKDEGIVAGTLAKAFNEWRGGGRKIDARGVGKLARAAGLEWGDIWNNSTGGNEKGVKGWRLRVVGDKDKPPEKAPADAAPDADAPDE